MQPTKVCKGCGEDKPLAEYYSHTRAGKVYYLAQCKPCHLVRTAQWRRDNPDKKKAIEKRHAAKAKARRLAREYGLSEDEHLALRVMQDDRCAICGEPQTDVDHDHRTGDWRLLLCRNCNRGLGYFQDDPMLLLKAAIYLNTHRSQ